MPGQFFAPYDVTQDRLGNVWTGGMNADRIVRISTESGEVTEYPLPHATNIRRVFVDNSTSPADLLGRQQPRRGADQARAAGLTGSERYTAAGTLPAAVFVSSARYSNFRFAAFTTAT